MSHTLVAAKYRWMPAIFMALFAGILIRVFSPVSIYPSCQGPAGLFRKDGKLRPDGMSLILWRAGKQVVWQNASPFVLRPIRSLEHALPE